MAFGGDVARSGARCDVHVGAGSTVCGWRSGSGLGSLSGRGLPGVGGVARWVCCSCWSGRHCPSGGGEVQPEGGQAREVDPGGEHP
ncbi:MAG: hypothetical protein LC808_07850, partial [Actinobacteria bacterium]|nr:hypothetical protein [Actinomycetota bacterium]